MSDITAWEKLKIVHNPKRPNAKGVVKNVFETYYEFKGDRCFGEDEELQQALQNLKTLQSQ